MLLNFNPDTAMGVLAGNGVPTCRDSFKRLLPVAPFQSWRSGIIERWNLRACLGLSILAATIVDDVEIEARRGETSVSF